MGTLNDADENRKQSQSWGITITLLIRHKVEKQSPETVHSPFYFIHLFFIVFIMTRTIIMTM